MTVMGSREVEPHKNPTRPVRSFPLDGTGRLAGDIQHDPVDALHLVDDAIGDIAQQLVLEVTPVGRHAVLALDDA